MGLMLGMSYEQKEMVLEADEIPLFYTLLTLRRLIARS